LLKLCELCFEQLGPRRQQAAHQLPLASEVLVQAPDTDAGDLGHARGGERFVAALEQHALGGGEDDIHGIPRSALDRRAPELVGRVLRARVRLGRGGHALRLAGVGRQSLSGG